MFRFQRRLLSVERFAPHIAIVGGGPSGCYVADYVTKALPDATVDVLDQLPIPFGLSRYGVAPDHPEVKNVEKKFKEMFEEKRAFFIGNMKLDRDYTIDALLEHYASVVVATGATTSRGLGIPGEHLKGVISGKSLVDYYNTVPEPYSNPRVCPLDLEKTSTVVMIGNGNVAIDCARFLGASWRYWGPTDINKYAVEALQKSKVKNIEIVGRRGPEHLACTIAELRELSNLNTINVSCEKFDLAQLGDVMKQRPKKRLMDLLHSLVGNENREGEENNVQCKFRFGRKPIKILEHPKYPNRVGAVVFHSETETGESNYELVECDAVVYSIGYQSQPHRGIPFDTDKKIISNDDGRVTHDSNRVYASGWARRGPKGVILQTMMDAKNTAKHVVDDLNSGKVFPTDAQKGKYGLFDRLIHKKSFPTSLSLAKHVWKLEKFVGQEMGKSSEKVNSVTDMLDLAMKGRHGRRAEKRITGRADARTDQGRTVEDFLDEESLLIDVANSDFKPHFSSPHTK